MGRGSRRLATNWSAWRRPLAHVAIVVAFVISVLGYPLIKKSGAEPGHPQQADQQHRSPPREVPEIRLSGAWLERIGFPKGRRYLISVDKPIETIYLQAEPIEPKKSRRRR